MGEEQRQALARAIEEDAAFETALSGVRTVEEAVRVAQGLGYDFGEEDFMPLDDEVSDADLEAASGGTGAVALLSMACWSVGCPQYTTHR